MKYIYRSTRDKILGGVAAGMADYFELDVVLVRLLWVLFILMGGIGLPLYIIAWIIIPPEPYPWAGKDLGSGSRVAPGPRQQEDEKDSFMDGDLTGSDLANGKDAENNDGADFCESAEPGEATRRIDPARGGPSRDGTNRTVGILLVVFGSVFLFRQTLHWEVFKYVWPVLLILLGIYVLVNDKKGV